MGLNEPQFQKKTYVRIAGRGKDQVGCDFSVRVEKGTPGAIERKHVDDTGVEHVKYELIYESLDGFITDIKFRDGKFGKMFDLHVDDVVLSINTESTSESKYFKSLALRIPNVDLSKKVTLKPYFFIGDDGKQKKGVTIYQGGKIIDKFFTKENPNGIPQPTGNETDKADWKYHYSKVDKFLIQYLEDMDKEPMKLNAIAPASEDMDEAIAKKKKEVTDEISESDLPF